MQYVILGKLFAKVKPIEGGPRVRVAKKAHIEIGGRTLCQSENAYVKPPRRQYIMSPPDDQICLNCLSLLDERYGGLDFPVAMGERAA